MAKRYRYAFAKKKEAGKGKLSAGLAVASFLLFLAAVLLSFFLEGRYGFIMGLLSFSEENCKHHTSIIGSIANGFITVGWIFLFLMGV